MRRKEHPPAFLGSVRYILMAMGDSNYTRYYYLAAAARCSVHRRHRALSFCNAGRSLDKRLLELGAHAVLPRCRVLQDIQNCTPLMNFPGWTQMMARGWS